MTHTIFSSQHSLDRIYILLECDSEAIDFTPANTLSPIGSRVRLPSTTKKYYFNVKIILKYYSGEYSKLGYFDIFLIWIMVVHNILN